MSTFVQALPLITFKPKEKIALNLYQYRATDTHSTFLKYLI